MSVPVKWQDVTPDLNPQEWTVTTVARRLSRLRSDPWKEYWTSRQRVSRTAMAAIARLDADG